MSASRLVDVLRIRSHAPAEDYHSAQQSLLLLTALNAVPAWLWVSSSVQGGSVGPAVGVVLLGIILGAVATVFRWHSTHYALAVYAFVFSQLLFVSVMLLSTQDSTISFLFPLPVLTAMLAGRQGMVVAATGATAVTLVYAGITEGSAGISHAIVSRVLLYCLAAAVPMRVLCGFHSALVTADRSTQDALRHAEEARRHRAELRSTLKSLDLAWRQLQRANSELVRARESADAALDHKRQFAAEISHELRTSLNLILGFSETMAFSQHSYGDELPAPYRRDIMEIYRNSRHLLGLIDDVLDLARLDVGKMGLHRELTDLGLMLRDAADISRPLFERKGLELVLDLPPGLPALSLDRTRIRQVVLNLLSNAVRATSRGHVAVKAECADGQVLVRVSDTGTGLSAARLERVFEEYCQMRTPDGLVGSTGLGLPVSRKIIQSHGGRMWAESTAGEGSTFCFALPLPGSAVFAPLIHTPTPALPMPMPAVVVTGEPGSDEVRLLQRHLVGYSILAAGDTEQVRNLASAPGARAVVCNAAVREAQDLGLLSVPLITCVLPGPKQVEQALQVARVLQKPVTSDAIQEALRRAAPDARSLLIVDDDPAAVRLLERMVHAGAKEYRVFRAYSGREALARVHAQRPDAMLLDLAMADGNGVWLLSRLRQDPETANTPTIVVTGRDVQQPRQTGSISITSAAGFAVTETLGYLRALLSAVPPNQRHNDIDG